MGEEDKGGGDQLHIAQGGGQGDQIPHGRSGSEIKKSRYLTT